ncbi:MAG TPA: CDP-alcohol phosphatidyltransferase family protein [Candidatus Coatesbacteria bacterium]|nr:CDP-alcohol phosphatidyltransferase family protein [Candidatus Coatesbacteria bacterium]
MIFWREWLRRAFRFIFEGPARLFARWGVSPLVLTLSGLLASLGSGLLFALGDLAGGAWLLLLAGFLDSTDGRVARLRGLESKRGAFLDSFTDRWADGAVLAGIAYFTARQGDWLYLAFSLAALVGSMTVSYAKARAEGLGLECTVGFWERPERICVLLIGGFVGYAAMKICVIILAAGAFCTALHRMVFALGRLSGAGEKAGRDPSPVEPITQPKGVRPDARRD